MAADKGEWNWLVQQTVFFANFVIVFKGMVAIDPGGKVGEEVFVRGDVSNSDIIKTRHI